MIPFVSSNEDVIAANLYSGEVVILAAAASRIASYSVAAGWIANHAVARIVAGVADVTLAVATAAAITTIVRSSAVSDSASVRSLVNTDTTSASGLVQKVAEFHELFEIPDLATPQIPPATRCRLRMNLLKEEVRELDEAITANDLVEIGDAIADIQYVLLGTALEFGLGHIYGALFDEVHRSNMSKSCKNQAEVDATIASYLAKDGTICDVKPRGDGTWALYRRYVSVRRNVLSLVYT